MHPKCLGYRNLSDLAGIYRTTVVNFNNTSDVRRGGIPQCEGMLEELRSLPPVPVQRLRNTLRETRFERLALIFSCLPR